MSRDVMRIVPDEMQATANYLGRLSEDAQQIQHLLQRSWQRLDHGWQSYAHVDADAYYHTMMRDLARMKHVSYRRHLH